MCAPGMLCISSAEVAGSKSHEICCVLPGHVEEGRVTAEIEGKAVASTLASPEPCSWSKSKLT
jgi:hypothetical protein